MQIIRVRKDVTDLVDKTVDYIIDCIGKSADPKLMAENVDLLATDYVVCNHDSWCISLNVAEMIINKAVELYKGE